MDLRSIVSATFDKTIEAHGGYARHEKTGLQVSTKQFGDRLWTLALADTNAKVLHAYPATKIGYDMYMTSAESSDVRTVTFQLLNEAWERIRAWKPYILASDGEQFHIPDERTDIALIYKMRVEQRLAESGDEQDLVRELAPALEEALVMYGSRFDMMHRPRVLN